MTGDNYAQGKRDYTDKTIKDTAPATDLAKKYDGYKYSIAPLKQTNETIMVFQKSYKTGSCLHDTLRMEEGDDECTCGAIDVDGNRVGTEGGGWKGAGSEFWGTDGKEGMKGNNKGRFPSQTYCDSKVAEVLDEQSGVKKSSGNRNGKQDKYEMNNPVNIGGGYHTDYNDTGGCSKILHKCDFEKEEHDLYHYVPKVGKKERSAGCEDKEDKEFKSDVPVPQRKERPFYSNKNNHPTVKPIALNEKILKLFKTPNKQRTLIPFVGSGSEIIGAIKAGYEDIEGCEINQEYIDIANARIKYWKKKFEEEDRQNTLL